MTTKHGMSKEDTELVTTVFQKALKLLYEIQCGNNKCICNKCYPIVKAQEHVRHAIKNLSVSAN